MRLTPQAPSRSITKSPTVLTMAPLLDFHFFLGGEEFAIHPGAVLGREMLAHLGPDIVFLFPHMMVHQFPQHLGAGREFRRHRLGHLAELGQGLTGQGMFDVTLIAIDFGALVVEGDDRVVHHPLLGLGMSDQRFADLVHQRLALPDIAAVHQLFQQALDLVMFLFKGLENIAFHGRGVGAQSGHHRFAGVFDAGADGHGKRFLRFPLGTPGTRAGCLRCHLQERARLRAGSAAPPPFLRLFFRACIKSMTLSSSTGSAVTSFSPFSLRRIRSRSAVSYRSVKFSGSKGPSCCSIILRAMSTMRGSAFWSGISSNASRGGTTSLAMRNV